MTRANKNPAQKGKGNMNRNNVTLRPKTGNPRANPASHTIVIKSGVPLIRNTAEGCIVSNQEMFGVLSGSASSGTNSVVAASLNPCDPSTFPWLSHLAQRYTLYRVRKLTVHLSSMVPTSVVGSCTIGGFYDREDLLSWLATATNAGLSQTRGSSSGPIWSTTLHRDPQGRISSDISFNFDCRLSHARTPWFRMDKTPGSDAEYNQAMGCHAGIIVGFTGLANQDALQCWFDYEIELLHPAAAVSNQSLREAGPYTGVIVVNRPNLDRRIGAPDPDPIPTPVPDPSPPAPKPQFDIGDDAAADE